MESLTQDFQRLDSHKQQRKFAEDVKALGGVRALFALFARARLRF